MYLMLPSYKANCWREITVLGLHANRPFKFKMVIPNLFLFFFSCSARGHIGYIGTVHIGTRCIFVCDPVQSGAILRGALASYKFFDYFFIFLFFTKTIKRDQTLI